MGLSRLLMSDDNDSVQARFLRAKLGKYFASYGRFCASHPWEVIVSCVTLTVCVLSMSIFSGGKVAIPCSMASGCGEVKTVTSDDFEVRKHCQFVTFSQFMLSPNLLLFNNFV